jgi:hypothetical protein
MARMARMAAWAAWPPGPCFFTLEGARAAW